MNLEGKTVYTDGKAFYFVREGISDNENRNYKVFKQLYGRNPHGYTGRGNPWTNKQTAIINLEVLAQSHHWIKTFIPRQIKR